MKPEEEQSKSEREPVKYQHTAYQLTALAASICPGLCQQDPGEAIKTAMKLLDVAENEIQSWEEMKELEVQTAEYEEKIVKASGSDTQHFVFDRGVKFITGEQVMTRALPWFRKFIRSRTDSEKQAEAQIVYRRAVGFGPVKAGLLQGAFQEWKATEKSALAKKSAAGKSKKKASQAKEII